jgi:hypothetical protein
MDKDILDITVHLYKGMLDNITVHLNNDMLENITVPPYKEDILKGVKLYCQQCRNGHAGKLPGGTML